MTRDKGYSKAWIMTALLLAGCLLGACFGQQPGEISGIYCLNLNNLEMELVQDGSEITFSLRSGLVEGGTGTISGDELQIRAMVAGGGEFRSSLKVTDQGTGFSGSYLVTDPSGNVSQEGILLGKRGECPRLDLGGGIPRVVTHDFSQLEKIEQISRFRSGFGHSFSDGSEECRSMKHYFTPYPEFRRNEEVAIYAPAAGTIVSITNDGHGASGGLVNQQIQIRLDAQPAITIELYHIDLASPEVAAGAQVKSGDLLGHARLYYPDLGETATSFDIAVWANTLTGPRLVSYFEVLTDPVWQEYTTRGVLAREDLIITQEERDVHPLECQGETFLASGDLENWVTLDLP